MQFQSFGRPKIPRNKYGHVPNSGSGGGGNNITINTNGNYGSYYLTKAEFNSWEAEFAGNILGGNIVWDSENSILKFIQECQFDYDAKFKNVEIENLTITGTITGVDIGGGGGGSECECTPYDDTEVRSLIQAISGRVEALETGSGCDCTPYDDSALKSRISTAENEINSLKPRVNVLETKVSALEQNQPGAQVVEFVWDESTRTLNIKTSEIENPTLVNLVDFNYDSTTGRFLITINDDETT